MKLCKEGTGKSKGEMKAHVWHVQKRLSALPSRARRRLKMVGEKKGRPRSPASPPPANYRAHIKHQAGDGVAAAKVFICIKRLSTYIIGIIIKKGNLKRKLHIMAHCTSVAHVFRQLWPPGAVLCFSILLAPEGLQLLCPVLSSYLFFYCGISLTKI